DIAHTRQFGPSACGFALALCPVNMNAPSAAIIIGKVCANCPRAHGMTEIERRLNEHHFRSSLIHGAQGKRLFEYTSLAFPELVEFEKVQAIPRVRLWCDGASFPVFDPYSITVFELYDYRTCARRLVVREATWKLEGVFDRIEGSIKKSNSPVWIEPTIKVR